LVEFASVVDALRCAAEVQTALAESNAPLPQDRRIEFRIGINVATSPSRTATSLATASTTSQPASKAWPSRAAFASRPAFERTLGLPPRSASCLRPPLSPPRSLRDRGHPMPPGPEFCRCRLDQQGPDDASHLSRVEREVAGLHGEFAGLPVRFDNLGTAALAGSRDLRAAGPDRRDHTAEPRGGCRQAASARGRDQRSRGRPGIRRSRVWPGHIARGPRPWLRPASTTPTSCCGPKNRPSSCGAARPNSLDNNVEVAWALDGGGAVVAVFAGFDRDSLPVMQLVWP
jgi:hypothetical protein